MVTRRKKTSDWMIISMEIFNVMDYEMFTSYDVICVLCVYMRERVEVHEENRVNRSNKFRYSEGYYTDFTIDERLGAHSRKSAIITGCHKTKCHITNKNDLSF